MIGSNCYTSLCSQYGGLAHYHFALYVQPKVRAIATVVAATTGELCSSGSNIICLLYTHLTTPGIDVGALGLL
jgi:hypothetical protein